MRADAERRRAAILDAARTLVAERGPDVALDAVAETAGVGIATLYRNFASRGELLDAVALAVVADVRVAVHDALAAHPGDGRTAWGASIRRLVGLGLGALTAALSEHVAEGPSTAVAEAQAGAVDAVDELLAVARDAGAVRPDVTPAELIVLIGMLTRPHPAAARIAPGLEARIADILLAGLRPLA